MGNSRTIKLVLFGIYCENRCNMLSNLKNKFIIESIYLNKKLKLMEIIDDFLVYESM